MNDRIFGENGLLPFLKYPAQCPCFQTIKHCVLLELDFMKIEFLIELDFAIVELHVIFATLEQKHPARTQF